MFVGKKCRLMLKNEDLLGYGVYFAKNVVKFDDIRLYKEILETVQFGHFFSF